MKKFVFFFIAVLIGLSIRNTTDTNEINVLFLGGGSGDANSAHNGKINHHKLKPSFLRSGIQMTYSSNLDDLNPETLSKYNSISVLFTTRRTSPTQYLRRRPRA